MIIAYYTNREGQIVNHHGCGPDATMEDLLVSAALWKSCPNRSLRSHPHRASSPSQGVRPTLLRTT